MIPTRKSITARIVFSVRCAATKDANYALNNRAKNAERNAVRKKQRKQKRKVNLSGGKSESIS